MIFIVDAVDIGIEPHCSSPQCTMPVALQTNAMNISFGQQITLRGTSLDDNFRKVFLQEDILFLLFRIGIGRNLDNFGLSVRICREIHHLGARCTLRKVVFFIARHAGYVKALDEIVALFAVSVDYIIYSSAVVLLENLYMDDVLTYENLVGHADNLVLAIAVEDNNIVDIRAVTDIFVFL